MKALVTGAVVLAALAAPAGAAELQQKFDALAGKVKKILQDNRQERVALVEVTGPKFPTSSSGPGVQHRLVAALGKAGVAVDQKAPLALEGRYLILEEEGRKDELLVRLRLTVTDGRGDEKGRCVEDLSFHSNDEMVKMLALTVDLTEVPKATPEERNKVIKHQVEKPPLTVAETKVKTKDDSPFAVEVLVRKKGESEFRPAPPADRNGKGLAFVPLERGDVYRLRLHNGSDMEAAVSVTIDGLDAFTFYEAPGRRPSAFLVAPGQTRDVTGWRRDTERENEFLVGAYSDSAAAKVLRSNAGVGTITLCFHPSWQGPAPEKYKGARAVEPNATTLGHLVKRKGTPKPRTFGPLLAAITIRYNK